MTEHSPLTRFATLVVAAMALAACAADRTDVESAGPGTTSSSLPAALAGAPSALDDPAAEGLPEPTIDLDRLLHGGPPPDGIPPIDDPSYTPATDVDFLADVEPVLVVTVAGETRILPVQIMTWHEIVNDTIGAVPVTVSYCPLCNSAITYDRRIEVAGDGRTQELVLDFGTSGQLYNSALVMYDRQTESLWSHFTGQAVAGALTGTELTTRPTSTVSWATARTAHPDAQVLDRDTGHDRPYGQNPYGGYDDVTTSPFLFDGDVDGRLAAKTRVIGIDEGDDAVAVRTESLEAHDVVDIELGGREMTVWKAAGTASALDATQIRDGRDVGATGVFDRTVDGRRLSFEAAAEGFVDTDTGSTWNLLGRAVDGPLAGTQLEAVDHVDTFWFAWAAFVPDTEIVPDR